MNLLFSVLDDVLCNIYKIHQPLVTILAKVFSVEVEGYNWGAFDFNTMHFISFKNKINVLWNKTLEIKDFELFMAINI